MATCFSATKGRDESGAGGLWPDITPLSASRCRIKVGSHCAARFLARRRGGERVRGVTVTGLIMPLLWRSTLLLCVWVEGGSPVVGEEEEEEKERW